MNLDELVGNKEIPINLDNPTGNIDEETGGDPAITFVIGKFREYYDMKKLLKAKLEEVQVLLDGWESAVLERFAEEGVEKITTGSGTFYIRTETYCSYNKDLEVETFAWLRDEGDGSLIKETINSKTLAAWAREKREEGVELPEFFNITEKRKIGVRAK